MTDKLTKAEVDYRDATTSRRCGSCSMYRRDPARPGGICTLVAGSIETWKVCNKWEPDL